MTSDATQLPQVDDPLGETLQLLRLSGTLYCRAELSAPWGIDLPAFEGCMMFHIVTAGSCLLEVEGDEPRKLRQGALALIPHGLGHRIRSGADASLSPLFDIPVEEISERYEVMRHGGGGAHTQLTCGVLRFDHIAAQRLIALLPQVLLVDGLDDDADGWLHSTLRFITREASTLRPGAETVITRLADILVIQAIRAWINSAPEADRGWLAALRDEQVGRALAQIHRAPEREWSLASLAEVACMSRSAFSARFTELVGEPAMRYLTHWRLQLARIQILQGEEPLSFLALRVGYQSEAAFCRAFKREFGVSPGSLRRTAS